MLSTIGNWVETLECSILSTLGDVVVTSEYSVFSAIGVVESLPSVSLSRTEEDPDILAIRMGLFTTYCKLARLEVSS